MPAKLSQPRVHQAVERARLFKALDEALANQRAAVIQGPAGSGKTTLLCSWAGARDLPCMWYQVDAGDADLGAFFGYLRLSGLRLARRETNGPPVYQPEHAGDITTFARNFFRRLFSWIPSTSVLVFDNWQDGHGVLDTVLGIAADEVPHGMLLAIATRGVMPSSLTTSCLRNETRLIDWPSLRLDTEEAMAMARSTGIRSTQEIRNLVSRAQGWAAGLRFLLEVRSQDGDLPDASGAPDHQVLFDFFAGRVLRGRGDSQQRWLMELAHLPYASAELAHQMCGDPQAGQLLAELYRERLFLYSESRDSLRFSFHPLLREFLLRHAEQTLSVQEHRVLWRRAGALCETMGATDAAFAAYEAGAHWQAAVNLIVGTWESLLNEGREATLQRWIEALPAEFQGSNPVLHYAHGQTLSGTQPLRAIERYKDALAGYERIEDELGQIACAASGIDAVFSLHGNHAGMDCWLAILRRLLGRNSEVMSPNLRMRAQASLLIALLFRDPRDPEISQAAGTLLRLLDEPVMERTRLAIATNLLIFCCFAGRLELASRVIVHGDSASTHDGLPRLLLANWMLWRSYFLLLLGRHDEGTASALKSGDIAREDGFRSVAFLSEYFLAHHAARAGDPAEASARFMAMSALCDRTRRLQVTLANACGAWVALFRRDPAQAAIYGEPAFDYARELGWPSARIHYGIPYLYGLVESRRLDDARAVLQELSQAIEGTVLDCFVPLLTSCRARIVELEGNGAEANALIALTWSQAARSEGRLFLNWASPWMARQAARGLEAGTHAPVILNLLAAFRWKPAPRHLDEWPWPVKIRTLGTFEVCVNDSPVRFGRKPPRKVLALLKLLICHGEGGLPDALILDTLWPELDGDAAAQALDIALHRLRRLLGANESILQSGGRIRLNLDHAWVDAWALQSLGEVIRADLADPLESARRLSRIYAGEFLPGDEHAWVTPARVALRARFVDLVERLAQQVDAASGSEALIGFYQQGIAADPLAEKLYLNLMRAYLSSGRKPEAIGVYHALRKVLCDAFGTKPSDAVERLHGALMEQ